MMDNLVVVSTTVVCCAFILNACLSAASSSAAIGQTPVESGWSESTARAQQPGAVFQETKSLFNDRKYRLARQKLAQAVRLWQREKEGQLAAGALLEMADRYAKVNRPQAALWCYQQALYIENLPPATKLAAVHSIAQLYFHLGQLSQAQERYQETLNLAQRVKDQSAQAAARAGLAVIEAKRGNFDQARAQLEEAQRLELQQENEAMKAKILYLLAQIHRRQGRMTQTQESVEQAVGLYRKTGDPDGEIQSLCLLSDLSLALGQKDIAIERAMEAKNLASRFKIRELHWRSWLAVAHAERALEKVEQARKDYFRAVATIELQRYYLLADPLRISFLAGRQAPFRELVDLLIELEVPDEAFHMVERARARATLDLLAEVRQAEKRLRTSDSSETLEEIAQQIARLRTKLYSRQLNGEHRAALQAKIEELEHGREEALLVARIDRRKRFTRLATLEKVRETMLQPNDVLVEFFLGARRSFVWIISPEKVNYAVLPGRKEIDEKVRQYLATIATKPNNRRLNQEMAKQRKLAAELFDLLLGPLAKRLTPGQRLLIAPDGLLNYLPFETLIREEHYLVRDHDIGYVPSASVLSLLQQSNGSSNQSGQMELLAFGNPTFGPSLEAENNRRGQADANEVTREIWASRGYRLPALPNTQVEVQSIADFFPADRRRIYLGAKATEEALKRETLRRYRRLHFATHSLIDERSPARAGVILTLDEDPSEDGFLGVHEIAELELDCDLVVLSACQTGRGQLVMGEGIVGLTRAFLYAGARSVAVSLWSVSDLSTAHFMEAFYRGLVAKRSPASALRQAKLEMIGSDEAVRHPSGDHQPSIRPDVVSGAESVQGVIQKTGRTSKSRRGEGVNECREFFLSGVK